MQLTDQQTAVLAAIADSHIAATPEGTDPAVYAAKVTKVSLAFDGAVIASADKAGIDPVEFSDGYGAGGAQLVIARKLQSEAAAKRTAAQAALAQAETEAQALDAQAAAIESQLSASTGTGAAA